MKAQKRGRSRGPKLQDGRLNDFSGGMNNAVHPAMLNENESALIQNNSLDEKGTLFPIKGRKKRYQDGVGSKPINGIAEYNRSDGVSRLIIGSGNSLYVDTPRLVEEVSSQADWEEGTPGSRISTSIEPGELRMDIGKEKAIATSSGEATVGTASYTYGWTITPKKTIRVAGFRLRGLLSDKDYKLKIWKVSDKSLIREQTVKPVSTAAWNDIQFADSIALEKDVAYRISIWCATANFMRYWTGGTAHAELTRGNSFYSTSDIFPETAWSTNIPGVDILFDVVDFYQITDTLAAWQAGTLNTVEVIDNKLRLQTAFAPFSQQNIENLVIPRQA